MSEAVTSKRTFHLQQRIGAGAFGEVFLAEQDSGSGFRRKVAIKLLHKDIARLSADAGRRMRDEARILGRLSHRNIVTVLDLLVLDGRWAVIMDFVAGADFGEVIQALEMVDERMPAPAALEAGVAVLNALHAAFYADDGKGGHLGVIHRDIKPSNIRLTMDGEVKVLDFGVARVNMDTREAQTRASGWIGTEIYMAPERILCEGDGPEGDVYAAAASIVELVRGLPLGRTPVREDTHAAFVEDALAECRGLMSGPDESVDAVIGLLRRGLHADPAMRPTASALAEGLERWSRRLDGEGLMTFTRRFMPRVDQLLARAPEPIHGTLAEQSEGTGLEQRGPGSSESTYLDIDGHDGGPVGGTSNSKVFLIGGGALFAGMLGMGALLLGAAVVVWSSGVREVASPPPVPAEASLPEEREQPVPGNPLELAEEPAVDVAGAQVATDEPTPAREAGPAAPVEASQPPRVEPASPRVEPSPPQDVPMPVVGDSPAGPLISRAMVVWQDASALKVVCGDVAATGTASTRIRNFPAGPCSVSGVYMGSAYSTDIRLDAVKEVRCQVLEGALTCS